MANVARDAQLPIGGRKGRFVKDDPQGAPDRIQVRYARLAAFTGRMGGCGADTEADVSREHETAVPGLLAVQNHDARRGSESKMRLKELRPSVKRV
jgi:hypothetical protein